MHRLTDIVSQHFSGLPDHLRHRKLLVWLFFICTSLVLFYGMGKIKADSTVESWFEKDDPTFVAYNEFHAQFGSEDGVIIVYEPKDGNVFSEKSLRAVKGIRDELFYHRSQIALDEESPLDHIVRVTGLTNVSVLTVKDDLLVSSPLVGDRVPSSTAELAAIRNIAKSQRDIPLRYFSNDLKYGAIVVDTDFGAVPCEYDANAAKAGSIGDMTMDELVFDGGELAEEGGHCFKPTDMRDYETLNQAIKNILYKSEYADHFEYYMVGNTAESEYQKLQQKEMGTLYLAALIIMIFLLWILFRSFSAVVWAMLIVVLTTTCTIGISGFLDLKITPFFILAAFLLLTVSMADAVHLMSGYLFFRKEGHEHAKALRLAYKKASVACLLTTITTMVGMGSLCFSEIVPVATTGFMGACGIAVAFILTMYLLPAMLDLWSPLPRQERKKTGALGKAFPNIRDLVQKLFEIIVPAVERRPVMFILPFMAVFILCAYGVTKTRVDSDMMAMYSDGSRFLQSVNLLDDKMAGSTQMSIYVDFGKDEAVKDPFVLKTMDELQKKFRSDYSEYVVTTNSIVNVVKDTYQKLNQGRDDMYIVPDKRNVLAQTLYMFNNADPEQRKRLIDDGYRKMNITVTLLNASSYEYNDVFENMQKDINAALDSVKTRYDGARVSTTGLFVLKMKLAEYLVVTALKSFSLAFLVINLLFLIIFGSLKAGLISIFPNIIPAILVIGLMGLLELPLDFFAMMLAPIIIGISVDDTIHFLTHYRMQYYLDKDIFQSVRHTMREAGQGVVFTTLILGLGFSVLSLSDTPGVSNLGSFGFLAVLAGLLNDVFLLPAAIFLFRLKGDEEPIRETYEEIVNIESSETL